MSLRLELALQHRLRLNLAEKNMPEQEMAMGRVRMALQILADGTVSFGELPLLKKGFGIGEEVFDLRR